MLAFEFEFLLLDVALDDGHRPEWVHVLESKVLHDLVVPHISFVQVLLSELVGVILSGVELELDLILPLQVARNVCVVAVVKALLLQDLLDAEDVFLNIRRHFVQVIDVFVEGNHFDTLDQINEIARWHPCNQLSLGDNDYEQMPCNVHDADDAVGGPFSATFVISLLSFCSRIQKLGGDLNE